MKSEMMSYYNKVTSPGLTEAEEPPKPSARSEEFGPWVWANGNGFFNETNRYSHSRNDDIKMNAVPRSISNISKELIKLHIAVEEISSFNGFGPWMKPSGFDPPLPVEKTKKKRKKEPNAKPTDKREQAEQEKEPEKANITDIVALSSHKTHSTPVDPVELKKRLVDLLVQRQSRGEQQALKLKKVNVKPLQVSTLQTTTVQPASFNGWQGSLGRGSETKRTLADMTKPNEPEEVHAGLPQAAATIAMLQSLHHPGVHFRTQQQQHLNGQRGNPLENIELEKGVKLPPVTQMATFNGKPCIVHHWPSSAQPHVRSIKNEGVKRNNSDSAVLNRSIIKRATGKNVADIIRGDLLRVSDDRSRKSRKLGDLSRNTRTECVKSRIHKNH